VDKLDVFAHDCEKQKEIGWGVVLAAGPDANLAGRKPDEGEVVFFVQGNELRLATDDSLIRLVVDSSQCIGHMTGAEVERTERKAMRPNPDNSNIVVPGDSPANPFIKIP
jgi:hypothetical protein